ncbi:mandelate racemase/muconate lactonizing enzyme family protein [Ancylobacter sp. MQZ15Z-1]|uniref:Mandelate racemase/muconate lactonizing enzyme family protein n=1 Tax=Ancylobacter mangrovi TaxID=2972472 RepID=A0A9X2T319_9HYPH|nr:mandelate racemase/muconate lactonizing enzyme family protein [Ancylobacter mangrovi]MCS0494481.1 mandelate racemase/muconate lactonizing enzyme family protein [Ancylobacter mangrovi]
MKITDMRVHPLTARFDKVRWTAHEPFDTAQLVLVEIRTDDGLVGIGEISTGPQASVCALLDMIAPVLTGLDPLAPEEIWNRLFAVTVPRPGGSGPWDARPPPLPRNQRPQFMAAMAGIDIALWDLRGKAAGLPVFRLLGGNRTDVFTYAVGGFYVEGESPLACADELASFVADGFRAVKLKTGALSLKDEVARVQAVRAAIGPDVLLMLDMNAPVDVEGCIRFARAVERYDIFWLEEPLHWYLQPSDFARAAARCPIPLAHGEREWHRFTVREFIDSGALGYVQFDCTRHAGFSEALRIAHYAAMKGVMVAPHTAAHLHAHLVSALGDAAFAAESVGDPDMHPIHHRIFHGGAQYRDGRVHLTEAPGFGLEVDWRAVEALKG